MRMQLSDQNTSKEDAKSILEQIIRDNSVYYTTLSCNPIGLETPELMVYYADEFVEFAKQASTRSSFVQEFAKFHKSIATYGYRGPSLGKKNGIVDIKRTDTQLLKDYSTFLTSEIIAKYGLNAQTLKPVKVVAHVPNGNRPVGVLDRTPVSGHHTIVILGMSNYRGKPEI